MFMCFIDLSLCVYQTLVLQDPSESVFWAGF